MPQRTTVLLVTSATREIVTHSNTGRIVEYVFNAIPDNGNDGDTLSKMDCMISSGLDVLVSDEDQPRILDAARVPISIPTRTLSVGEALTPRFDPGDTFNRPETRIPVPGLQPDYVEGAPIGSEYLEAQPARMFDTTTPIRFHWALLVEQLQRVNPNQSNAFNAIHTPVVRVCCCTICQTSSADNRHTCIGRLPFRPSDELRAYPVTARLTPRHAEMFQNESSKGQWTIVGGGYNESTMYAEGDRTERMQYVVRAQHPNAPSPMQQVRDCIALPDVLCDLVLGYAADPDATGTSADFMESSKVVAHQEIDRYPDTGGAHGLYTRVPVGATARVTSCSNFALVLRVPFTPRDVAVSVDHASATTKVYLQIITTNIQQSCVFVPMRPMRQPLTNNPHARWFTADHCDAVANERLDVRLRILVIDEECQMTLGVPVHVLISHMQDSCGHF